MIAPMVELILSIPSLRGIAGLGVPDCILNIKNIHRAAKIHSVMQASIRTRFERFIFFTFYISYKHLLTRIVKNKNNSQE